MNRIVRNYDPDKLTNEFLYNTNDWDLIELNYELDPQKLSNWFQQFSKDNAHLKFSFDRYPEKIELSISKKMVEQGYCGYYCGPIEGITLAWPKERYEPLPPPTQANPEIYSEVNYETFIDDAKIMTKFKAGYLKEMIDILGEDSFRQCIITIHHPGMYIKQHIDSKILKLHIPVETHDNAFFHFGKNRELGKYNMKLGKIYILNTGDWHGTTNESDLKRSHIITRIMPDQIQKIIRL